MLGVMQSAPPNPDTKKGSITHGVRSANLGKAKIMYYYLRASVHPGAVWNVPFQWAVAVARAGRAMAAPREDVEKRMMVILRYVSRVCLEVL